LLALPRLHDRRIASAVPATLLWRPATPALLLLLLLLQLLLLLLLLLLQPTLPIKLHCYM
jgi:hypothetical protein